jgi:hypothetical protein
MKREWCIDSPDSRAVVGQDGYTAYGRSGVNPAFSAGSVVGEGQIASPAMADRPGASYDGNTANGSPGQTPVYDDNGGGGGSDVSAVYGGTLLLRNRRWNPIGHGSEWNYPGRGPMAPGGIPASDLPSVLRSNDCVAGQVRYTPMNPRASMMISERTNQLMQMAEGCAFVDRRYPVPPTQAQPRNGREFQEMRSIGLSTFVDDINTVIGTFQVPWGCNGMLNRVVTQLMSSTGFIEGGGGMKWRVQVGSVYARNLGEILFQYGSLTQSAFVVPGYGIKLVSGQLVTLIGNKPTGSAVIGAGARVAMGVFGWYWPKK